MYLSNSVIFAERRRVLIAADSIENHWKRILYGRSELIGGLKKRVCAHSYYIICTHRDCEYSKGPLVSFWWNSRNYPLFSLILPGSFAGTHMFLKPWPFEPGRSLLRRYDFLKKSDPLMGRCFLVEKFRHKIVVFSKVKNDRGLKVRAPEYPYQGVITHAKQCHIEHTYTEWDVIFLFFWWFLVYKNRNVACSATSPSWATSTMAHKTSWKRSLNAREHN